MENDKSFAGYGASYSFDRPPPYSYDAAGGGPSAYTYNSMTSDSQMKLSAPIQSQPPTGELIQPNSVNNIQIHISDRFGPYSQNAICPHCHQYVVTKTKPVSGAITWFTCLGLMLIGCFLCCCLIPFCCNSCQNVDHRCPNCKRKIGHYTRMC